MDWSQIVTQIVTWAPIVLTGGLVSATVGLWCSTNRYRKATEQYAEVSEKLLRMERLDFFDKLFQKHMVPWDDSVTILVRSFLMGVAPEDSDAREKNLDAFYLRIRKTYGKLAKCILDDLRGELEDKDDTG